jgi:hypothetical protein
MLPTRSNLESAGEPFDARSPYDLAEGKGLDTSNYVVID